MNYLFLPWAEQSAEEVDLEQVLVAQALLPVRFFRTITVRMRLKFEKQTGRSACATKIIPELIFSPASGVKRNQLFGIVKCGSLGSDGFEILKAHARCLNTLGGWRIPSHFPITKSIISDYKTIEFSC